MTKPIVNNKNLHKYFFYEEMWYGLNMVFNPRFIIESAEALIDIDYSHRFLNSMKEKLADKWSERGIFNGLPNISTIDNIKKDGNGGLLTKLLTEEDFKCLECYFIEHDSITLRSLMELSSLLQLMIRVSRTKIRNLLLSGANYLNQYSANFAVEMLKSAAERSQEEGLIIVLDMTKSTPYIIKGEKEKKLEINVEKLYHCLIEIGNCIWLSDEKSKYWIMGGDSFISFTPLIDEFVKSQKDNKLAKILLVLLQTLKRLKSDRDISFKVGCHFGAILILGKEIYSNKEIITATRTQ